MTGLVAASTSNGLRANRDVITCCATSSASDLRTVLAKVAANSAFSASNLTGISGVVGTVLCQVRLGLCTTITAFLATGAGPAVAGALASSVGGCILDVRDSADFNDVLVVFKVLK